MGESADVAMAAAVAAAAELAKNGGMSLYPAENGGQQTGESPPKRFKTDALSKEKIEKASSNDTPHLALRSVAATNGGLEEDTEEEGEEDAEKRLARSRERNREHARRTRLRKKAQLEALQSKVKGSPSRGP